MFRKAAVFFAVIFLVAVWVPYGGAADKDLEGRIIILDAGHFEGYNKYSGYSEGTNMLVFANKIKPLLEARGATVYMTRTGADDVPFPVRAALINKWALEAVKETRRSKLDAAPNGKDANTLKAEIKELDRLLGILQSIIEDPEKNGAVYMNYPYDYTYKRTIHPDMKKIFEYENDPEIRSRFLMISLHSNATPAPINTSANGADVYYCSNTYKNNANYYKDYSFTDLEIYFGGLLLDKIDALGIKKRKVLEDNWFVIREHNLPGVLAENGFHTNADDRKKLSNDDFLNSLASAYADTIAEYFAYLGEVPQKAAKPALALPPSPRSISPMQIP